ncbi:MAG: hypothetical protein ACTSR9_17020 [Candidatus Thorarchaeota archaeon]
MFLYIELAVNIAIFTSFIADCRFFFVANKIDERTNGIGVSSEDGTTFAQQFDAPMMEVSAKTGGGVTEMFETVTRMLLNA